MLNNSTLQLLSFFCFPFIFITRLTKQYLLNKHGLHIINHLKTNYHGKFTSHFCFQHHCN